MTRNIVNEFKAILDENEWMDKKSKIRALEKADFIKTQIGYPDDYDNTTYVNIKYNVGMR